MSDTKAKFSSADVRIEARETGFKSFLRVDKLQLRHKLHEGGWSETLQRELLVKTPAVGVLLVDPDREELVMVRQFRLGMYDESATEGRLSPWPLELVAGLVDKNESLEEVARREIREETGLEADDLIPICDYYNSPGASSEKVTLFCACVDASTAGGIHGLRHEHEDIEVVVMSTEEALSGVHSGIFNNAMTLIALQWLALNREQMRGLREDANPT